MHRMILKNAAQQLRAARRAAEEAGEEWEGPVDQRVSREYDDEALRDLRQSKKDAGDDVRTAKRRLRNKNRADRRESGVMRIEWSYEPGELVKIKASAYRRNSRRMEKLCLYEGAVGVIVEHEDDHWRDSAKRVIHVMGPAGLQAWDAAWVEIVDE